MNGDGIMNLRRDSTRFQKFPERGASWRSNDVLMKRVKNVRSSLGKSERRPSQPPAVLICELATFGVFFRQIPEQDAQNCRLQLIQAAVDPSQLAHVTSFTPSVLAQRPDLIGQSRAARDDCAAIAKRAEIFRGIKAEGCEVSPGTGSLAGQRSPV